MALLTLTPVELYLSTSYRPDCDFVDGEVLERNVGEKPHATLQTFFAWLFRSAEVTWGLRALTEQRVQVTATRYRVADVCIVRLDDPDELIVRTAPVLCIEVLSREDRMSEMLERVSDYQSMGVRATWVIDPWRRKIFVSGREGQLLPESGELKLEGTEVSVPVGSIFAELDRYTSRPAEM